MNIIWTFLFILCSMMILVKCPQNYTMILTSSVSKAINLSILLLGIYAFWLGMIQIFIDSKLLDKATKLFYPITSFLFRPMSDEARKYVTLNLACNMFGIGNACTPSGIKAVTLLSKNQNKANYNTVMFIILNTTSIQLLPTTVISLRASMKSTIPTSIILPSIIATSISTLVGIILVKLFSKFVKDKDYQ